MHGCPCGVAHWHMKVEVAYIGKAKRGLEGLYLKFAFHPLPEYLPLLLILQIVQLLNYVGFSFQSEYIV